MSTKTSHEERLQQLQRREGLTVWIGAAYGGLVALLASNAAISPQTPAWVQALLVTLIVAGAGALGKARVGFEWAATQMARKLAQNPELTRQCVPDDEEWPRGPESFWTLTLYLLMAAGLFMLLAAWWGVLSSLWPCR
ncbi:MAG TPA: hypothetical protein VM512_10220 [Burkholderiaceae bacterium]|jgi:hypothetical protein|nr:hypothetical protein [Burkholderiaceae bacterium]